MTGFTLMELLLIVFLLGVLAVASMSALDGIEDDAAYQVTRAEMAELATAIRQFKRDTGWYPGEGQYQCADGATLNSNFLNFPSALANDAEKIAWCEHPANLWMLFDNPMQNPSNASEIPDNQWNPESARGWRGPYLTQQSLGKVNINGIDEMFGLHDKFPHKPMGINYVWNGCTDPDNKQCVVGRPYYLRGVNTDSIGLVSHGENGVLDVTGSGCEDAGDDLVVCLK
jgi:type II secretory pathway pseudopilin PulG